MPRIRTVKPRTFSSGSLAKCSRDARLLFIGIWTEADDEGRLLGSPKRLAGNLFPHDEGVTAKHITRWLQELIEVGSLVPYVADGVEYLYVPGFKLHQRISHPTPSVLPPPPGEISESLPSDSGLEVGSGSRKSEQGEHPTDGAEPAPVLPLRLQSPKVNGQPRPDQAMFGAVAEVCGWALDTLTDSARGRINSAAKELRDVGATVEDVRLFAVVYGQHWPDSDLTPQAISGNWAAFKAGNLFTAARRRR